VIVKTVDERRQIVTERVGWCGVVDFGCRSLTVTAWFQRVLVLVTLAVVLILSGCGYAGEPKPPAFRRPLKVADLGVAERGSKIVITFLVPWETTEGLPIEGPLDVEVRVGLIPTIWSEEAWRTAAERVPVPQVIAAAAAKSTAGTAPSHGASGATGASGRKSIFGFVKVPSKPVARVKVVPDVATLFRSVSVDAAKYSGKTVAIGVLVHGPKGRDEGWSIVQLEVLPVLPVPLKLHAVDAPGAVHLEWTAAAPGFRIFRKQPADKDWVQIGESVQPAFDDTSFHYGSTWQYYVESVRKTGTSLMESDASETITFAPVDRFPPPVPTGLVVISGTRTVELVWDGVTDAELAGYRVYRNGVKIADALVTPAYSDKGVTVGSTYSYQVSAVDRAGNESARCAAVEKTME
jgi:hypothetical protein